MDAPALDPRSRFRKAQAVAGEKSAALREAAELLTCSDCRYLVEAPLAPPGFNRPPPSLRCSHPVYMDVRPDHIAGKLEIRHPTLAADARKSDGLCGPEAVLFEVKPAPSWIAPVTWWAVTVGAALVLVAAL